MSLKKQTKPNLFIVGQPKSGTSALYSLLREHSEISACEVKEPQYFCFDLKSQYFHLNRQERSIENYLSLYKLDDARYQMEASTAYLYSKVAAENIAEFNPKAKIIMMFREPVEFLYTYHQQLLRNSCKFEVETDFMTALNLEEQRRNGICLPDEVFEAQFLLYSERVKYFEQAQRYLDIFSNEKIKILLYDDFKENNRKVYEDVLEFLDLDKVNTPRFTIVNKQAIVRSRVIKQYIDKNLFGVKRWIRRWFGKKTFRLMRSMYRTMIFSGKPFPPLHSNIAHELRPRYLKEVQLFSKLIKRDLIKEWGYEGFISSSNKSENAKKISL